MLRLTGISSLPFVCCPQLAGSRLPRKSGLDEKIELLLQAEENYYQKKTSDKQDNKLDKNAISETLREASKKRILNALRQAHQRLGNLNIEFETSSSFLENECFKKYGKSGKTFYYSQVAGIVRWLSTTTSAELTNHLSPGTPSPPDISASTDEPPETPSASLAQRPTTIPSPCRNFQSKTYVIASPSETTTPYSNLQSKTSVSPSPSENISLGTKLPAIPSFSEFVNKKRAKDNHVNTSQNQSHKRLEQSGEKRMRLH